MNMLAGTQPHSWIQLPSSFRRNHLDTASERTQIIWLLSVPSWSSSFSSASAATMLPLTVPSEQCNRDYLQSTICWKRQKALACNYKEKGESEKTEDWQNKWYLKIHKWMKNRRNGNRIHSDGVSIKFNSYQYLHRWQNFQFLEANSTIRNKRLRDYS